MQTPIDIWIGEDDETGYTGTAHIESLMYFPQDEELQEGYIDTKIRDYLIETLEMGAFPALVDETKFRILAFPAEWSSEFSGKRLSEIKRNGYIAAMCLRYYLSARLHHPEVPTLLRPSAWEHYLIQVLAPALGQRHVTGSLTPAGDKSKRTGTIRGTTPVGKLPFDPDTLRKVRVNFMPVAHLWAVSISPEGGDLRRFGITFPPELLDRAEEFRMLSERLDVYAAAVPRGTCGQRYRVRLAETETDKEINAEVRAALNIGSPQLPKSEPTFLLKKRFTRSRTRMREDAVDQAPAVTPRAAIRAQASPDRHPDTPELSLEQLAKACGVTPLPADFVTKFGG